MAGEKKQKEIEQFLQEPIKEGDSIIVPHIFHAGTTESIVDCIDDGRVQYRILNQHCALPIADVQKITRHIGANPFPNTECARVDLRQVDLEQLIHLAGFSLKKEKFVNSTLGVQLLNWEPFVIDKDGKEVGYQRPFVWTIIDKHLLLDSIYHGIDIGKFVFRHRSYGFVQTRQEHGLLPNGMKDIVDGKQRLDTLIEFVSNQLADSYGNYWDDLSEIAQRKFLGFRKAVYGEMQEDSTDEDVLNTFLSINFTGAQMSREHIEYVKSINLK